MSIVHTRDGRKVTSNVVRVSKVSPQSPTLRPSISLPPKTSATLTEKDIEATTPRCRMPLGLILFGQCLLVAAIFATLIVVVTVRVTATTKSLVEERIASDLQYSKGSILSPIETSHKIILASRLRYIAFEQKHGYPMCNETSYEFSDSKDFLLDALGTSESHAPEIDFSYVMHKSMKYSHLDGTPQTFECGASLRYMYVRTMFGAKQSTNPLNYSQCVNGFQGAITFVDNTTDYGKVAYFKSAMVITDFTWQPYLFVQQGTGLFTLLLGGYVPILLNRTLPNGTVETFAPDLSVPQANKRDPTYSVVSSFGTDISLAHVSNLLKDITPPTEGAHTSLYDLKQRVLLATSESLFMMNANSSMWPAGASPSQALNDAFWTMNPRSGANGSAAGTRIVYHKDRILSAIHITTASDIDFVIIQSTPIEYYLGTVYTLRTLMIVLGVCAAVIVVTVCVGVALVISRKIAEIEGGMLLAAVLKNDQVQPCRSFIGEMDSLCVAFARMNAKLGAARAFMPQSMLVSDESGDDNVDEGSCEVSTKGATLRDGTSVEASKDNRSASGISMSKRSTMFGSPTVTTKDSKENATLKMPFQSSGLQSKRVTMLCVNTLGFHRRSADAIAVSALTTDLTASIQDICVGLRGVIDSFHGDHYVLSFNAAKHNAQGPQSAARCGLDIMAALGPKVAFSMGVAAGRALVGHLGSTEMKRFSIVGKVYSQAVALERVCKQVSGEGGKGGYGVPQLVADRSVTPEIAHSNFLQVLGRLEGGEASVVYGVLEGTSAPASNEEWLYEVMNSDSANGTFDALLPAVNEAMEALLGPGTVLENMPRFGAAVGAAAEVAARSPALVGREWGQQALLRAMAVLRSVSTEAALKLLVYSH